MRTLVPAAVLLSIGALCAAAMCIAATQVTGGTGASVALPIGFFTSTATAEATVGVAH